MDKKRLASFLDLANHHPEATPEEIKKLCQAVKRYGFHSAFVNGCYVGLAKELMNGGRVGTVISFPIGQDQPDVKTMAAIKAVKDGADELDVSMNVGWFKNGQKNLVLKEMKAVVAAGKSLKRNLIVKFIIETGFLNEGQIKEASKLVLKSGADFVKTCSGWGPRGAQLKDVILIKQAVGDQIKIKVAGGIHSYKEAVKFIEKGASRVGTSKGIEIIKGIKKDRG